jgi:thiamine-phosphate pyrophosphorylase
MRPRKRSLGRSRLYVILDKEVIRNRPLKDIVRQLKKAGCDIIQYRDKVSDRQDVLKNAFIIKKMLLRSKTLFIINDYPEVARICGADGLHIGQEDISLKSARCLVGKDKLLGVSCHSLAQALRAQENGADYLGIGPVFRTPTKPKAKPVGLALVKKVKNKIKIPFFPIGGINFENIADILACGVRKAAVCRAVLA